MLDVILTIFWGLILLTAIVFVHELGHFLAARAFKLRVKEFMIGLPGPKISFKRKDTRYGATAIPLGGYCLIAGMERGAETEDLNKALSFIAYFGTASTKEAEKAGNQMGFDLVDNLDTLADWGTVQRIKDAGAHRYNISQATIGDTLYQEGEVRQIPDIKGFLASEKKLTYNSLPWWKRVTILLAGSFSNLIVALGLLIAVIMFTGAQVATTTIDSVNENSPAAEAGIVAGDVLTSLNGEEIQEWGDFITLVREFEVGDEVTLGYTHEGVEKTATIKLADSDGIPLVGVVTRTEPINIIQAAERSFVLIGSVFQAILQLFNPETFSETIDQTSSVIGITIEARNAADAGAMSFILLIAALSISIGFMNLLPIPPLDGGKIIIETVERVSRRQLSPRLINGISMAGFAAMIMLFVLATNADIHRYFLGG